MLCPTRPAAPAFRPAESLQHSFRKWLASISLAPREREREVACSILGCCTPTSQCPAPQQCRLITKHNSHTPLETCPVQDSIKDSSASTPQQVAATHHFGWGCVSQGWGVRLHGESSGMLYASVVVMRTNAGNSKADEYWDGVLNGPCIDHGRYEMTSTKHLGSPPYLLT